MLAEPDLTGRRRAHRAPRPRKRDTAGFFDDLKTGDFVVHHQHGVARYGGMVKRAIGGVERDYLLLEYRGDDRLYVPSDQIDAVRHYTGGDSPSLSKLGGSDWQKTKARVRSEVETIAQELVVLYQKRLHTPGHAFPEDTPWQRELEEAFPYKETPDQDKAIADVKADMEAPVPMDRLVCGDVGFGKTEVAIRAAFKAIQDGKQVAVLVPTTLLATQHFQTFSDRFAGFPVRVEVLSRFLTPGQAREVAEGMRIGDVDCVIGTHRLLSDDIQFKDLGLLVVDEEQRFGVSHKEQIKQLTNEVDVLTLTATPIPRTLEMSLTGIRDLTLLNTPPAERQPILTYVGEQDERAVAEAIRRELLREGQVFFVHNRVRDIEDAARRIRELVPEARVAVAHGQMDEGTLERVVLDFWEGEFDVLVCTTIIESGIDMPTVNTLVVDRADLLGLGQLHQLRGRVGRAGQRAYAYLFHPRDRSLTEEAYERLKTIGEATELGSGFRIAMRDLEIRGAGTLLGTGQSGHIAAVGYDLYFQMVNEAVAELKGEPIREPAEVKLDLPLDAHLPPDYVPKEELRLEAYRRLAAVTSDGEVDDIRAEWEDRYGPVPDEAAKLLDVARLRAEGHRLGVREINVTKGPGFGGPACTARVSPLELKTSQQIRLNRLFKGAVYKAEQRQLVLPIAKTPDLAGTLVDLLRTLVPPEPDRQRLSGHAPGHRQLRSRRCRSRDGGGPTRGAGRDDRLGHGGDGHDVGAHAEHGLVGLGEADRGEQRVGVGHALRQVGEQPGEALDGEERHVDEAGGIELVAQLGRVVEVGPEAAVDRRVAEPGRGDAGHVVELARPADDVLERAVDRPRVTGDHLGDEPAARPQHTPGLGERVDPVVGIDEVVQRTHEEDGVGGRVLLAEVGGSPEPGRERVAVLGRPGPSLRQMGEHRVDQRDVVAETGEVRRVHAGPAADVEHPPRRREVPLEQVPGAQPRELTLPRLPEPLVLGEPLVEADDVGIDLHAPESAPVHHAGRTRFRRSPRGRQPAWRTWRPRPPSARLGDPALDEVVAVVEDRFDQAPVEDEVVGIVGHLGLAERHGPLGHPAHHDPVADRRVGDEPLQVDRLVAGHLGVGRRHVLQAEEVRHPVQAHLDGDVLEELVDEDQPGEVDLAWGDRRHLPVEDGGRGRSRATARCRCASRPRRSPPGPPRPASGPATT